MDEMRQLEQRCLACRNCPLFETRKHVVFGTGDPHAELMFVGEGPGATEDEQGLPFVGRAGQLLDDMLEMIDLDRSRIYIANIVKCRPPQNRDPLGEEQAACMPWLQEQFGLIRPRLLVCLGRIAAAALIKPDFRITQEHWQWFQIGERKAMAIYHPAALLRDPGKRPETFVDLRSLRAMAKQVCEHLY